MTNQTKSEGRKRRTEARVLGLTAALLLLLAAGCGRQSGAEEITPSYQDSGYMAVDCGTAPTHRLGKVLFELRIGTPGSAVGFRIRQAGPATVDRTTGGQEGGTNVLSFEFGNLDERHGGPLCFDVAMAGYGTVN